MNTPAASRKWSHEGINTAVDIISTGESVNELPIYEQGLFINTLREIASSNLTADEKYERIGIALEKASNIVKAAKLPPTNTQDSLLLAVQSIVESQRQIAEKLSDIAEAVDFIAASQPNHGG